MKITITATEKEKKNCRRGFIGIAGLLILVQIFGQMDRNELTGSGGTLDHRAVFKIPFPLRQNDAVTAKGIERRPTARSLAAE